MRVGITESIEMIKTMKWQSMDGLNKGEGGGGIWGDLGDLGAQGRGRAVLSPPRKQNDLHDHPLLVT